MHLICNQEMVGSIPTIPVTENAKGVKLVSGASANILESVMTGDLKVVTPYEFMLKMLEPYSEFDKLAG